MNVKAIRKRILINKDGFEREEINDPVIPNTNQLITKINNPAITIRKSGKTKVIMRDEFPTLDMIDTTQEFYLDRVELIQVEYYKEY